MVNPDAVSSVTSASSQSTSSTAPVTSTSATTSATSTSATSSTVSTPPATGGGGFSLGTVGDLRREYPQLYYMVEVQIFMVTKQLQDDTQARIHQENQEAYQDNS